MPPARACPRRTYRGDSAFFSPAPLNQRVEARARRLHRRANLSCGISFFPHSRRATKGAFARRFPPTFVRPLSFLLFGTARDFRSPRPVDLADGLTTEKRSFSSRLSLLPSGSSLPPLLPRVVHRYSDSARTSPRRVKPQKQFTIVCPRSRT